MKGFVFLFFGGAIGEFALVVNKCSLNSKDFFLEVETRFGVPFFVDDFRMMEEGSNSFFYFEWIFNGHLSWQPVFLALPVVPMIDKNEATKNISH